ncbi:MAG: peroxiredoxin family protein [Planctomycetota bacterium]
MLPAVPARDGRPALEKEVYEGDTREAYVEHLEAFRDRTGVTYPFVLVEEDVFESYPIAGYPTMVLVDPDGTVGLVAVGGMKDAMLRIAIDRRLEAIEASRR